MLLKIRNLSLIFVGVLLVLSSCIDLEEQVFDEVTEENFNPQADDIPNLVGDAYWHLRPMYMGWQGNFDLQEEPADIIVTPQRPNGWVDGGIYQRMHFHTWTPLEWPPWNVWNQAFNVINGANRVMYQIESGTVEMQEGETELMAELRALRAFAYYILLDNHGNVPVVTSFEEEELPVPTPRAQVFDFVVNELNEVIPDLTDVVAQSTYGRINRWTAKTLLARLYLNAEVYAGTSMWDEVIEVTDAIIAGGQYQLAPHYRANFTVDNEHSPEIIFAIPYDEIHGPENLVHMKTLPPAMQQALNMRAQPWGGNAAVPQFIDTYDEDDTRKDDTWFIGQYENPETGEVVADFVNHIENISGIQEFDWGYAIKKYEIPEGSTGSLPVDFPVFRYAEVLMMNAEALLRTGRADEAAQLVTQVRERAFAATDPDKAEVSGSDLLSGSVYEYGYWEDGEIVDHEGGDDIEYGAFLDELGWEFAAEAQRRSQLIRFGVYTTKSWFQHQATHSDHLKIFPIAENILQTNPNLEQNPGYD